MTAPPDRIWAWAERECDYWGRPFMASYWVDRIHDEMPGTEAEYILRDGPTMQAVIAAARAQCCMCGKTGLSLEEDGGPECELHDGRWVCSSGCWERAQPDAIAATGAGKPKETTDE